MTNNVYKFPTAEGPDKSHGRVPATASGDEARQPGFGKKMVRGAVRALWFSLVLVWPLLKWVVALSVVYQTVATAYSWGTPESDKGLMLAVNFAVLVTLTYFVSVYKPHGVDR